MFGFRRPNGRGWAFESSTTKHKRPPPCRRAVRLRKIILCCVWAEESGRARGARRGANRSSVLSLHKFGPVVAIDPKAIPNRTRQNRTEVPRVCGGGGCTMLVHYAGRAHCRARARLLCRLLAVVGQSERAGPSFRKPTSIVVVALNAWQGQTGLAGWLAGGSEILIWLAATQF